MKFVVFGDDARPGLVEGERVLDIPRATGAGQGGQGFGSLLELIEAGDRGLDLVQSAADKARGSDQPGLWSELAKVQLQAPWPGQRLVLAGANNADHVANCFTNMKSPRTAQEVHAATRQGGPGGFWGLARPVMGPNAEIQIPARAAGYFDYEGEPGVILGRRGKDIKAKDFSDYVWGVTLVVDWSAREPIWPPPAMGTLCFPKTFDCSKSIGPCIVVGEIDPGDFHIETLVNGKIQQSFSTKDMIFSFGEFLEHVSQDFTFYPGDVIAGGTGAGTAIDQTVPNDDGSWPKDFYLKPGDTVEVRAQGIGSLVSRIVPKA
jgi:2-keto-4-pentenoate hydratase/2-oxohepta-3-ene-1,7-dioic acid hydratase in catechol pathway